MGLEAGGELGPYRVVRELGRGKMGVVVEAQDTRSGVRVALKALPPEMAFGARRARFAREFEAMKLLEHPAICRVFDSGTASEVDYYAMELLPGPSLDRRVKDGAPLAEIVGHIAHVARGLDLAHRHGIVHRDVKSENILLGPDGRARLMDFGLARDLESGVKLTRGDAAVGTRYTMAPEQILREKVDGRADIFALGVLLYEAIAGELPFKRGTEREVIASLEERPAPPSERRPGATDAFDEACLRAIELKPEDRFATAAELADALEAALRSGGAPRTRRSRAPAAVVALLVVAGAGVGTALALRGRNEPAGPAPLGAPLVPRLERADDVAPPETRARSR